MDNFKGRINEKFYYPILMHPHKLYNYQWFNDKKNSQCDKYKNERKIGMVFIGNNDANYLEWEGYLEKHYNCFSRSKIINFLCTEFAKNVLRPKNQQELDNLLKKDKLGDKILIIDKFRVDGASFIDIFLNSDFHIWMPGVTYTYCHNHIESLFCGTIPICQNTFFYYGLDDKNNSLKYSTLEELKNIILDLISGRVSQDSIKEMRKNVYELYNSYYSSEAYRDKIFKFLNSDKDEEIYYIGKD